MKIEVKDLSPVKKSMSVEVGPEEVERETERVLRRYSTQVKFPGFRPGKAPKAMVRTRFAKEIQEDVRDALVSRLYGEAAREKGYRPLGDPVLDEVHHHEGEPFRIQATFEIVPEVQPKDYKGVEVRRGKAEVGDTDVDKVLEELRDSNASLEAVEGRAAGTGDFVVADVVGTIQDDDAAEPFERERALMEVGASDNLPEFNEGLEGVQPGDVKEFRVPYPEGYHAEQLAGKTVHYKLTVHEIKVKKIPELDDEFAKDMGDFESLDALRARIREDLVARKEQEVEGAVRRDVLDKILVDNPVPLPEILVESEIRNRLEDMIRSMMMQGMDPEKMDLDWKQLRERQEEGARKAVHARLVLDAIARDEGLQVDPKEVDARIRREAERIQESYEDLRARLRKGGGVEALQNQILREKSLDFVTSVANIRTEE